MSQQYNNLQHNEPMINMPIPSGFNPIDTDEHEWKHLLTKIRSSVKNKLTFLGIIYVLIGLLSIGLECELVFDLYVSYIGGFVNGLLLFIVGIVTLILCRQQIYVLTSLFVLLIVQLHVTIITFGFYCYFIYDVTDDISHCSDFFIYPCSRKEKILLVLIADVVHLFLTFCAIVVNLIIITNARRPPTIPITSNYIVYPPQTQTQTMPATFQNPCAPPVTSTSSA